MKPARWAGSLACAGLSIALAGPVRAAVAPTSSVDDIVSALAAVVRDRAKAVAARTAKKQIVAKICQSDPLVINQEKKISISFGGTKACRAAGNCGEDFYFVETCKLAVDRDLELTDPHLLKALGRDVVGFALRVAASGSDSARAKVLGLPLIAGLAFGVLEVRTNPDATVDQLVQLALEQADKLRPPGEDAAPFQHAAASKEFRARIAHLDGALAAKLKSAGSRKECATELLSETALKKGISADPVPELACAVSLMPRLAPEPPAPDSAAGREEGEACTRFLSLVPERGRLFQALFKPADAKVKPWFETEGRPDCAAVPEARRERCEQARLALTLSVFLHKSVCWRQLDDKRRQLRALLAIYEQELRTGYAIYQKALDGLFAGGDPAKFRFEDLIDSFLGAQPETPASDHEALTVQMLAARRNHARALEAEVTLQRAQQRAKSLRSEAADAEVRTATRKVTEARSAAESVPRIELGSAARAQLADGLRMVALATRAFRRDKAAFADWRGKLADCVTDRLADIAGCPAFDGNLRDAMPPSMQALRDKVLDFYDVPRLFFYTEVRGRLGKSAGKVEEELVGLIGEISRIGADPGEEETAEAVTRRMVRALSLLADLMTALAEVPGVDEDSAVQLSSVLKVGSDALAMGVNRDWFGVALLAQDTLDGLTGKVRVPAEVTAVLRFSRTLLSMFQAASVDDAKAIFEAQLESLSSREQRYEHGFTVDLAALLGARVGSQGVKKDAAPGFATEWFGGAFAPVGVQLTLASLVGVLVYPLDVGSYLVADGTGAPSASAAVRYGGAAYLRLSGDIPLVFGLGTDYRPAIGDERAKLRGYLFAAMELPLFIIH